MKPMNRTELDTWHMRRALELAGKGEGFVEPNPMVGCVIAHGAEIIGEGWHRRYGGPHAEVEALRLAGDRARGATLYVTLEPCCHQGKTPPCTRAVIGAGVARVVVAQRDPFPLVSGGGVEEIQAAGIPVEVGLLADDARRLNSPYLKLVQRGRPWIIGKWAMTLDGKIATRTGASRWISGEQSRAVVHALRGRVDAILVGSQTARLDDPQLTPRPAGARTPLRIVLDSRARLASESQLVRTAREVPVLVAVGPEASDHDQRRLTASGCEVWQSRADAPQDRLASFLDELGRRRLTNVLVEGGGRVLGSLADLGEIDEVHVFLAPLVFGGSDAPGPIAGLGAGEIAQALRLESPQFTPLGADLHVHGRVARSAARSSE
jgi:diaminohydroxyphosphoribosylaminopyrimidine deaminase/5-amino-6-(5-phosphoribosylamino)uracil reductase